jgi:hypothetical protein
VFNVVIVLVLDSEATVEPAVGGCDGLYITVFAGVVDVEVVAGTEVGAEVGEVDIVPDVIGGET